MTPQEEIDFEKDNLIAQVERALAEKRLAQWRSVFLSLDQSDNETAFEADRLPIKRYDNTRGFEPT